MPDAHDWRSLYPFASHWLEIDGHGLHYLDEGSGPPLLLVHGNPTWSFFWREVVKALRPTHRVVAVDHIGCGLSDKPSPREYPYRLARRIRDLGRLVEALDLREITLVAHDWGGAIGMGAAVAAPDRFSRFVLLNTAAFRSEHCPRLIRLGHIPILSAVAIQGLNLFARAALRLTVTRRQCMTPAVRAGYLAPYDSWRHRAAIRRFVMDIPLGPKHPSYQTLADIEAGLPQFRDRPVLLIWGMDDWCFTPRFLERFIEFFPQAEVHRLDGAGHYVLEDAPDRVIPILRAFLAHAPNRT
ncbi:MAG: alpha/beta fold hydrolase [Thermoguttaceae bacterium]|jgi:haloalkane dehalogenase|nr:alpha/beta fold hydrolase [Thermoguttaceae bacterium]